MSRRCTLLAAVTLLAACGSAGCTADAPWPSHSPGPGMTAGPTETPGVTTAPPPSPGDASEASFLAYSGAVSHAGSSAYSSSLSGTTTFASVGCDAGDQGLQRVDAPQQATEGGATLTIVREGGAVSLTFTAGSEASGPAYTATSDADGHIAGLTFTHHLGRWTVAIDHVRVSDPGTTTGIETVTLDGKLSCPAP